MKAFIIAEAGVNHNGEKDLAYQLIDAAVQAGADAVKFQTFQAEKLVTKEAARAEYQKQNCETDESQFEMLKKLELSHEVYLDLARYAGEKGISFLSSAFDSDSLVFIVNELDVSVLKIASGELTNGPFLLEHAKTGKPLILSTGMGTLDEIREALAVIAFGLLQSDEKPDSNNFNAAFKSIEGQRALKEKVTLLHCTTEYPAGVDEINLLAMKTMADSFNLPVGYSDHSKGLLVPALAVAMGAVVIEKHLTVDKNLSGPDHRASLDPAELTQMVKQIRLTERAMGDGRKKPAQSEKLNRSVARKSLTASTDIRSGEIFTRSNLSIKRPGTGISPMQYWETIGATARRNYEADEVIS